MVLNFSSNSRSSWGPVSVGGSGTRSSEYNKYFTLVSCRVSPTKEDSRAVASSLI